MSSLKILHAADLHLDSAFEALGAGKAAVRRSEQRDMLARIAEIASEEDVDLVLLSGDLLDSSNTFYETGEVLIRSLRLVHVPVFIAPGNHDYYSPRSPYARLKLPDNVYVFTDPIVGGIELPELNTRVFGAAFTDTRSKALLTGIKVPDDGVFNILCIHGEVGNPASIYNPVTEETLAESGLDYAAFGHIHKPSGLQKAGKTWYSWPGCPEGRGFDETGDHFINIVELFDDGRCELKQVSCESRRYCTLEVDISCSEPLLAIHNALPEETVRDIYRITLRGETDTPPNISHLQRNLEELFFSLQLRDETRIREDIWAHSGEDTLRGLFLKKMRGRYDRASEDEKSVIEQAVRWGLAAIDKMEEVSSIED